MLHLGAAKGNSAGRLRRERGRFRRECDDDVTWKKVEGRKKIRVTGLWARNPCARTRWLRHLDVVEGRWDTRCPRTPMYLPCCSFPTPALLPQVECCFLQPLALRLLRLFHARAEGLPLTELSRRDED